MLSRLFFKRAFVVRPMDNKSFSREQVRGAKKMNTRNRTITVWLVMLAAAYAACVLYITLFSRDNSLARIIIRSPFHSYRHWIFGTGEEGTAIFRNVALFIPFGYLSSALLRSERKIRTILFTAAVGAGFSLFIEATQYYLGRGMADIDDLFNNTLGAILGALLFLMAAKLDGKRDGRPLGRVCRFVVSILLMMAGIIGCARVYGLMRGETPDVSLFDFEVTAVECSEQLRFSGRCCTYDMPTPPYTIYVKGRRTVKAETVIDGDNFKASASVPTAGEYEILIKFRGYGRVSTVTYIRNGTIGFVQDDVPEVQDVCLKGAVLKAYSAAYDTFVYEKNGSLIWLIGFDIDNDMEIIFHIDTNEREKLPDSRKQYGFDNRGFKATSCELEPIGHYRVFRKELPDSYSITGVTVGFASRGTVFWAERFRVERAGGEP